jgi:hypothetical protein
MDFSREVKTACFRERTRRWNAPTKNPFGEPLGEILYSLSIIDRLNCDSYITRWGFRA